MSSKHWSRLLHKHAAHFRTQKIIALVPKEHAPSETSDKTSSDDEQHSLHPSFASSPAPSVDSSLERMHLLSSDDDTNCDTDEMQNDTNQEEENQSPLEDVPLTPIFQQICPLSPKFPAYDNIPSLSSIPSLASINPSPSTSDRTPLGRKTRSKKMPTAPVAKKPRRIPKFVLTYKWKKAIFRHRASIDENDVTNIQLSEEIANKTTVEEHDATSNQPDKEAAIDYFFKFFSPDIITEITEQTNIYSVQLTGKSIQLTENELQDFLAIHILMGIVQMPSYVDYWGNCFRFEQIADIMPLKRYQQIRRFLHFVDNNLEDSDRYYKVRNISEMIRRNCLQHESENTFSIDEMMIAYKGRKAGNRKQYVKDKPNKWGFKNYVRAGVSGMIYDFIFYGGADTFRYHRFTDDEVSLGFGAQIVIALCQSIKSKPAVIFCDNFFLRQNCFIY
ncbi:unnamed protein product [Euphydryas editha]|uniref:PiggyBac transposable element-derived protein domain-containing protein n=1 Tax=Euphydryas editha TaxID=104508 RepID=A0AAU9TNE9_EUPED|nr:unnamed protein product [Euphydryas editha]